MRVAITSVLIGCLLLAVDGTAAPRAGCADVRGYVSTLSVSPTEQQGTIVVKGRKLDGYRVASLRGLITGGTPGGGFLLNHSIVFTHARRPASRLFTEGDVVTLTPTADPCVLDVVEEVHLAGGEGTFADVDVAASSGRADGTINVCTSQNRFDLTMRLCRRAAP